jgi:hypothetical protein
MIDHFTFEFKLVVAALRKLFSSFRSTGIDISVRYSTDFFAALRNADAINEGCIPG